MQKEGKRTKRGIKKVEGEKDRENRKTYVKRKRNTGSYVNRRRIKK